MGAQRHLDVNHAIDTVLPKAYALQGLTQRNPGKRTT